VLFNLLANAVKFTTAGEVRLTVASDAEGWLRLAVTDTGMGIEPDSLDRIFEAFGQTSAGAAAGGTGLGLTISRRLVRTMGGELTVASTPGVGSVFSFSVPVGAVPHDSREWNSGSPSPCIDARLPENVVLTALVADDNTINRRVLTSLLESAGVRVMTASGGREAVDLAIQLQPDVVLMDRRMNDLDGFEATRAIHAHPDGARIPVLAVTASAFGDVREAARNAGCVDFIPKPIRAEVLFGKLQQHLGVEFVSARSSRRPAEDAAPSEDLPARMADRLREASILGDVTALEELTRELRRTAGTRALAARIALLTREFDFQALQALAESLADAQSEQVTHGSR
jgi:CheY-like chemotaxis protein